MLTDSQHAHDQTRNWTVPVAFTTGDIRIVTERWHSVTRTQVVCAEPSPDIAKAVATAIEATRKRKGPRLGEFGFRRLMLVRGP
jgi:hypothetical protein